MAYWVHLNTNSFVFKKEESETQPLLISARVLEVDEDTFNTVCVGSRFVDGQWEHPEPNADTNLEIQDRVDELNNKLRNTDRLVLECLEYDKAGEKAPTDFDSLFGKRKEWREERDQLLKILNPEGAEGE